MVLKEPRGNESNKQDSWVLASATEPPPVLVEIRWRLGLEVPPEIPRPRPLTVQRGLCLPATTFHSNEVLAGTFTDFLEYILSNFYFLTLFHEVLPPSNKTKYVPEREKVSKSLQRFHKTTLSATML